MMHGSARLVLVPLLLVAILTSGCGFTLRSTTPGGTDTDTDTTLTIAQASSVYGETMCEVYASITEFGETVNSPDSSITDVNAAAALLQHDLEAAVKTLRIVIWPHEAADDIATLTASLDARVAQLGPLITAESSEDLGAAADNTVPESAPAEERLLELLHPPACPNPDVTYPNIEEFRSQFVAAGGECPDESWALTSYPPAAQAGNCEAAFLAVYSSTGDRDAGVSAFQDALAGGVLDLLVGPNWILGVVSPEQYSRHLGGTIVDVP